MPYGIQRYISCCASSDTASLLNITVAVLDIATAEWSGFEQVATHFSLPAFPGIDMARMPGPVQWVRSRTFIVEFNELVTRFISPESERRRRWPERRLPWRSSGRREVFGLARMRYSRNEWGETMLVRRLDVDYMCGGREVAFSTGKLFVMRSGRSERKTVRHNDPKKILNYQWVMNQFCRFNDSHIYT